MTVILSSVAAIVVLACTAPSTLTITYSWPPNSEVRINNLGVPTASLSTAIYNWNYALAYNGFYQDACYGPFFSTSYGTGPTINLSYEYLDSPPGGYLRGVTVHTLSPSNRVSSVEMKVNTNVTNPNTITEVVAHELGHTVALWHCTGCSYNSSVMVATPIPQGSDPWSFSVGLPGPSSCDISAVLAVASDYVCPPEPPPSSCPMSCDPFLESGDTLEPIDFCLYTEGCPNGTQPNFGSGCCSGWLYSPILVGTVPGGFSLTDPHNGVWFDIKGDGVPLQLSWTAPGSSDAWLALDRNGNGLVDNGLELFGNLTPQTSTANPNGFLALAEYDKANNGGNGDGMIDASDAIFLQLRLWRDINHNGVSEPSELYRLVELGLQSIDLRYKETKKTDQYGNQFRFRSKVSAANNSSINHWAWDVYLKSN